MGKSRYGKRQEEPAKETIAKLEEKIERLKLTLLPAYVKEEAERKAGIKRKQTAKEKLEMLRIRNKIRKWSLAVEKIGLRMKVTVQDIEREQQRYCRERGQEAINTDQELTRYIENYIVVLKARERAQEREEQERELKKRNNKSVKFGKITIIPEARNSLQQMVTRILTPVMEERADEVHMETVKQESDSRGVMTPPVDELVECEVCGIRFNKGRKCCWECEVTNVEEY